MAEREGGWWLTPRVILVVIGLLVLLIWIASSHAPADESESRLTTFSADPDGARGLMQMLQQLGWTTTRRLQPYTEPLDSTAVYAVLDPQLPLLPSEVHHLLDAVRRGAGLVVVPRAGTAIADSLHVEQSAFTGLPYSARTQPVGAGPGRDSSDADTTQRADSSAPRAVPSIVYVWHYLDSRKPLPGHSITFLEVRDRLERSRPAVLGIPLGRGRVVTVADPRIFTNAVVRLGSPAVFDTRLIEWLTPAMRRALVFDEYHQGFGSHGSLTRAVGHAVFGTPAGRMLLQGILAALLLLFALGARAIPPVARARIERRSPMEHVHALAHAYEQGGATRTASRRLLRGLRRRHPAGSSARADADEAYLTLLRMRHPSLSADTALLSDAIRQPRTPEAFLAVGHAITHIERTLTS
ncbi:MAG TPA: DUF4350 domain-containing protein [Gemmatimonadaceae bacterium]|nr:DUF4350 domain-containing protein [Gemmatimonadaceae bacterium]